METVNDIIKEIRGKIETSDGSAPAVTSLMSIFIDRLDAAYKRDLKSIVDAGEMDVERLENGISNLNGIIDKLKSELGESAKWTRAELNRELAMNVELNNKLREENARLTVALKPVLEVRPRIRGDYVKYKCWDPDEMIEAIVETQRIYNGEKK